MAIPLDHDRAREVLERTFSEVEAGLVERQPAPQVPDRLSESFRVIFRSDTQAYREVFLGCVVARILDRNVDVHQPYANQGPNAFSGRSLDEQVVNPFLHDHQIPSSRGPYLAVFRRSVQFDEATAVGMRDQQGYSALLVLLEYLAGIGDAQALDRLLRFTLRQFAELREAAQVPIARLHRLSLPQYGAVIDGLLSIASGGRFPVLLVQATVLAMNDAFGLGWEVQSQGINVADRPAGVGGDITIARGGSPILVIEVTEQSVTRARLVATFRTKIAPASLRDYLFVQRAASLPEEVMRQAEQYFAQGHEVNFVEIQQWIIDVLSVIGAKGRNRFLQILQSLIDSGDIPRTLKTAWNAVIARTVGGS